YGFLFFALLFSLWLALSSDAAQKPSAFRRSIDRWIHPFFTSLLIVQTLGAAIAAYEVWRYPFSAGRAAAAYIRAHEPENAWIAAGSDYAGATLSGYLDKRLYYPQGRRWGSVTRWDYQRIEIFDD